MLAFVDASLVKKLPFLEFLSSENFNSAGVLHTYLILNRFRRRIDALLYIIVMRIPSIIWMSIL